MDRFDVAERPSDDPAEGAGRISRRRFVGYLIAAPTVVAAADMFRAARRRRRSRRSSRSTSTT